MNILHSIWKLVKIIFITYEWFFGDKYRCSHNRYQIRVRNFKIRIRGQNLPIKYKIRHLTTKGRFWSNFLVRYLVLVVVIIWTAWGVALEKESRLKEYMLMMGLSRRSLWISYFIHYFIMFSISVWLVVIALWFPFGPNGAIMNYSRKWIKNLYSLIALYSI